eukprot:COSAG05_NODE_3_length_51333_cov_129.132080_36_plen_75_part_00
MHFHHKAVNALVHGRKKWAAYPPGMGVFSTTTASVAFAQASFDDAWECTQASGDIVYIIYDSLLSRHVICHVMR